MTTWTTERITNLKKLWTLGQPASAIATILGNVTRNAILGKVHRLGLSNPSPASAANPPVPRPAPRQAASQHPSRRSAPPSFRRCNPSFSTTRHA